MREKYIDLARQIIDYMDDHSDVVTLKDIAAHFSYRPNYISSLLHKETGRTFTEILLEKRMERAVLLMKKLTSNTALCIQPFPHTIVSCRDKEGNNNALCRFCCQCKPCPVMVVTGITPTRYSHHMVKESRCFVINFPKKSYQKEYNYLGSASGRDKDKFQKAKIQWENADYVDAPILTDCPVSIECSVVNSIMPGTHELFIGKVEAVHVDEEYLDANGNILWDKMDLI